MAFITRNGTLIKKLRTAMSGVINVAAQERIIENFKKELKRGINVKR